MPEPPDYDELEREQWRKNAREVFNRLRSKDSNLIKRIDTFMDRFGYPFKAVRRKIRKDRMFAAHFAKEPLRTGLHEAEAAKWLEKLSMIRNFKTLPKSRKNAVFITSDGGLQKNMKPAPSKSLDFQWETNNFTVYAAHKYTKEGGGNQDSQFKEMRDFLEKFQKASVGSRIALLVIVDGPYYGTNRMADLRRFCRTTKPFSHAMPIGDVPDWLEAHCVDAV